jgi:hypothetical protein
VLRKIRDLPETISIFFASTVSSMKALSAPALAGYMSSKKSNKTKTDFCLLIVLDGSMNFILLFDD